MNLAVSAGRQCYRYDAAACWHLQQGQLRLRGIHPDRGGRHHQLAPSSSLTLVPTLSFTVVPVSPHPSHCHSMMYDLWCTKDGMLTERMRRRRTHSSCVGACAFTCAQDLKPWRLQTQPQAGEQTDVPLP